MLSHVIASWWGFEGPGWETGPSFWDKAGLGSRARGKQVGSHGREHVACSVGHLANTRVSCFGGPSFLVSKQRGKP